MNLWIWHLETNSRFVYNSGNINKCFDNYKQNANKSGQNLINIAKIVNKSSINL